MKKIIYIVLIIINCNILIANDLDSLKRKIETSKNDTVKIRALNKLAEIYIDINKDSAILLSSKALKLSKEKNIKLLEIESYRELGIINIYRGDFSKAIKALNEALILSIDINAKEKVANIYYLLGISYYNIDEYSKAIEQYEKALRIAEQNNFENIKLNCYNAIGVSNKAVGNYDKAIKYYFKSLELAEKTNNQEAISNAYNNIGVIYKFQKLYDEAINFYKKSYIIDSTNKNLFNLIQINQNLGVIYKLKGNYNKALEYYKKSLNIAYKIDSKTGKAKAYTNIAIVYLKQKNYNQAIKGLQQSLKYNIELNDRAGQVVSLINLGQIYIELYDSLKNKQLLNKALNFSLKAYNISNEIKVKEDIKNSAALLKDIFNRFGEYKKALKYADIYIALNKELYNKNKIEVIESLKRKYENEKNEILIEKLQKEQYLRNQKIKTQQLQESIRKRQITVLTISLIVIFIFFIYVLYSLRKNKKLTKTLKKLNKDLEEKSKELKLQYLTTVKQNIEIQTKAKEIEKQKEEIIQKQNELKELDEDYKRIIDTNTDIVFIIDKNGKILFLNKRTEFLLKFEINEVIGNNFLEYVPESEKEQYLKAMHKVIEITKLIHFESFMKRKDGMHIPVEIFAQTTKYKNQEVITGTVRDITERKIAEQELKEKTEKYELITNAIDDLIWMVDFNLKFLYISPSSVKTIGYTFEEIVNISSYHIFPKESLQILRRKIAEARVHKGKRVSAEINFIDKNGNELKTNTIGHIIVENGKELGFIAVSRFCEKLKINK